MAKIDTAKRELFNKLKDMVEVTGAAIKGTGDAEHIVIFVQELSEQVKEKVPNNFKGITVKTETGKRPKAL